MKHTSKSPGRRFYCRICLFPRLHGAQSGRHLRLQLPSNPMLQVWLGRLRQCLSDIFLSDWRRLDSGRHHTRHIVDTRGLAVCIPDGKGLD